MPIRVSSSPEEGWRVSSTFTRASQDLAKGF